MLGMKPFFSILVPVYNVAPYLREALDSVSDQTFTDWECICVNDGSTDGSGAILDEYATKDARFKVIHQSNQGVSVARNAALDCARGEYISFLDGDDILLPYRLTVAHTILTTHPVDLMRLQITEWFSKTQPPCSPSFSGSTLTTTTDILNWGIPALLYRGWCHPLFIRNASWLKECRFPVGLHSREDNIFDLDVLKNCSSIFIGDDKQYLYRQRPGSAVHSRRSTDDAIRFILELERLSKNYSKKLLPHFYQTASTDLVGFAQTASWLKTPREEIENYYRTINKFLNGNLHLPSTMPFYFRWCAMTFFKRKILWPTRIIQALILFQYHVKPKSWRHWH